MMIIKDSNNCRLLLLLDSNNNGNNYITDDVDNEDGNHTQRGKNAISMLEVPLILRPVSWFTFSGSVHHVAGYGGAFVRVSNLCVRMCGSVDHATD